MNNPSPESVMHVLERLGVTAGIDGFGLFFDGPEDVLTDELMEFIRIHREELVAHLLARITEGAPPPNPPGDAHCKDCGTPSGTALRCPGCATARTVEWSRARKK